MGVHRTVRAYSHEGRLHTGLSEGRGFGFALFFCTKIMRVAGDPWLIRGIETGIVATFATNPDPLLGLSRLHVHSTLKRISISRDYISELENVIQNTRVAIMKSHALIVRSDEINNRV